MPYFASHALTHEDARCRYPNPVRRNLTLVDQP
ncbi:conserved hypothetical protein [Thiomonas arsenitoxydans]|uniref:Uncharacterized protein n=1 Tax=Thiomonas arsenitoxydans (strain DSM 22701 / CIP 110005 / 3As) TaxID=426114 RepID=D6CQG7_THIA3|nr:hypothetical protein THI_1568 [Thiomonas arsenitoxydans]CQR33809.1 conserved hypothetical protein [Thiomonas arsenitoxydans]CQR40175.1 conserved hypothetical protein [Thiomonas arsenitoxydans]